MRFHGVSFFLYLPLINPIVFTSHRVLWSSTWLHFNLLAQATILSTWDSQNSFLPAFSFQSFPLVQPLDLTCDLSERNISSWYSLPETPWWLLKLTSVHGALGPHHLPLSPLLPSLQTCRLSIHSSEIENTLPGRACAHQFPLLGMLVSLLFLIFPEWISLPGHCLI